MNKAFIIKETVPYEMAFFLVFAETSKEAITKLNQSGYSITRHGRKLQQEEVMEVQASYSGEDVIELGGYSE